MSIYSPAFRTVCGSAQLYAVCRYAFTRLRLRGLQILNYLNDWLVLAQSRQELCAHRSPLLVKTSLSPSQWVSFLSAVFDSVQMQAWPSQGCSYKFRASWHHSKFGSLFPSKHFRNCWASWLHVDMGSVSRRKVVMTDTSKSGWGTLSDSRPAFSSWMGLIQNWHTSCLEMMTVFKAFQPELTMSWSDCYR